MNSAYLQMRQQNKIFFKQVDMGDSECANASSKKNLNEFCQSEILGYNILQVTELANATRCLPNSGSRR